MCIFYLVVLITPFNDQCSDHIETSHLKGKSGDWKHWSLMGNVMCFDHNLFEQTFDLIQRFYLTL